MPALEFSSNATPPPVAPAAKTASPPLKILMPTLGSAGDVHPVVGVGRALQARGHEVYVVTSQPFAKRATDAGLGFISMATEEEFHRLANHPDLWDEQKSFPYVAENGIKPMMHRLLDLLQSPEIVKDLDRTVVVYSGLCFGARIAEEFLHVVGVSMYVQPVLIRSMIAPPQMSRIQLPTWFPRSWVRWIFQNAVDKKIIDPTLYFVNEKRKELSTSPQAVKDINGLMGDWMHSPNGVIGTFPDWFAPIQEDWPKPTRLTGFPLWDPPRADGIPTSLQAFLDTHAGPHTPQAQRPIVFTAGSAMLHGHDFFATAARTAEILQKPSIFLTTHQEHLPSSLPQNSIHVDFMPLAELLPHCAALVHHGGIGTMSQAMQAGIPQVIVPMSHDQFDNAARVKKLGVGTGILREKCTSTRLAKTLAAFLDESPAGIQTRQTCRALAENLAKTCDGPTACNNAALAIEELGRAGLEKREQFFAGKI